MTDELSPPRAPARPAVLRAHDDERVDPWFWLCERDNPEVLDYLRAENAYTDAALASTAALRGTLFDEIVGRVQETDVTPPVRRGPWEYFTRTIEGMQYDVHCRRPAGTPGLPDPFAAPGTEAGEQIVLDENVLAGDHDYFAIGDLTVSTDHSLVAYTTDNTGGERHELRVRDIATGRDLDDVVPDVYYGVAWATDNSTILFTRPDDAMRPWQIVRHVVGTAPSDDILVFQEDDDRFYVGVGRTRTDRFLVIMSGSKTTTEVWLVEADDPVGPPRLVEPREQGHEYHVEHHHGVGGDRLLVLTNADGAENFKLMSAPTDDPGRAQWTELLPHRPDVRLDDIDAFAGHLALSERAEGLERIRVLTLAGDGGIATDHLIAMPEAVYSASIGGNAEFDTDTLRYRYTSLVSPPSAYDYDIATRASTLVKQQPVIGYDRAQYESRRLWATAADGTEVPISLVYRRDLRRTGPVPERQAGSVPERQAGSVPERQAGSVPERQAGTPSPMLLYGYGSYEISIDPSFSSVRVSLLDRGVMFAIAHIRGGGELGRPWYEGGKLLHKTNTFTDFVACAEHLVREGYTAPDRLVARGGSAGGLLMGAVANLRPDLFAAIVAEVPFVDCLTTILDETLPLTITEWEEWGDPLHDPEVYSYMKAYSPYDNVEAKDYPALFISGGLNDPRVQYWEPAKWAAKLRATKTDDRLLVLKMEMGAGHSGPSGRYDDWKDEAFVLAFVLDQLGIRT
jgi:oligopeptidase B